jgi:hypothetical protein
MRVPSIADIRDLDAGHSAFHVSFPKFPLAQLPERSPQDPDAIVCEIFHVLHRERDEQRPLHPFHGRAEFE